MPETGYGLGESLILTKIQAISAYNVSNAKRADWKPLNQGRASSYAILRQEGATRRRFEGHNLVNEPWVTIVEVWQRYVDDGTSAIALQASVESIVLQLDKYPHLGDTSGYVFTSDITEIRQPLEMWKRGGGPAWLKQEIVVSWVGQRTRTFLD